jgi:hypothetical protein
MNGLANLTLQPQKNELDGISLREPVNLQILDKCIHSDLLLENCRNPMAHYHYTNEKTQLLKYRDIIKSGFADVNYNRSKGCKFGRSNPDKSLGLFTIRCEVRHTICDGMTDIDIANCHPELLRQLVSDCPILTQYCDDREPYLAEVMQTYGVERWAAKVLFIRILYGGGFEAWAAENKTTKAELPFLKAFRKEVKRIAKNITELNPLIRDYTIAKQAEKREKWENMSPEHKDKFPFKEKNINGTTLSYFLQEYEIRILECLFLFSVEKQYIKNNIAVLCADGMQIMSVDYKPEILTEFNAIILEKFGFNLTFTTKPMNEGFKDLDKHIDFDFGEQSTANMADYLKMRYGNNWIVQGKTTYFFNGVHWQIDTGDVILAEYFKTKFLKSGQKILNKQQKKATEKLMLDPDNKDLQKTIKTIASHIVHYIQAFRDSKKRIGYMDDFKQAITDNTIIFDTQIYLFAFNNKIMDLRTRQFVLPNPLDYVSFSCGYDYEKPTLAMVSELWVVLNEIYPDPEVRDDALISLATGLCGTALVQLFIHSGTGGNGKTIIQSLMMDTVGEYGYRLPSSLVISPLKTGANPELANVHNKRYTVFEEPPNNKPACSVTMKEYTGGQTTFNARGLYSSNTQTYNRQSSHCCLNGMLRFDVVDAAMARRIRVIPYESAFLKAEDFRNETNTFLQKPFLSTEEWRVKYRMAFFDILADNFHRFVNLNFVLPAQSKKGKKLCVLALCDSDDMYSWFSDKFEEADGFKVSIKELLRVYKESEYFCNLSKQNKRDTTMDKFNRLVCDNFNLKKHYKARDEYYQSIQLKSNFICGWRLKSTDCPETNPDEY